MPLATAFRTRPQSTRSCWLAGRKPDGLAADDYSRGGVVEQLETRMAALLGKEAAVWLPTGTLANHLAVRLLAGNRRRVLVQAESHLYQRLRRLRPDAKRLEPGSAGARARHIHAGGGGARGVRCRSRDAWRRRSARSRSRPRCGGARASGSISREMKKIAAWARAHEVGTASGRRAPVPGERLYAARPVKEYAALFDTVYISHVQVFQCGQRRGAGGAEGICWRTCITRAGCSAAGCRTCGPSRPWRCTIWTGFERRFRTAVETAEAVISTLGKDANFELRARSERHEHFPHAR